jgi:hypothetical protein
MTKKTIEILLNLYGPCPVFSFMPALSSGRKSVFTINPGAYKICRLPLYTRML